ncbi:MAG TPA: M2 family metallopeptidase, partial [Candidatus Polarisedimenticolia bacterium]|nr:M2 family metallopeptidase [Candidatus Polarisedimenticolia bacterium]
MTASPRRLYLTVLVTACLLVLSTGVSPGPRGAQTKAPPPPEGSQKTLAAAKAFIESAEKRLLELGVASDRADWVQQNFITEDTEQMAAVTKKNLIAAVTDLALKAKRFDGVKLPADQRRKFDLLKLAV